MVFGVATALVGFMAVILLAASVPALREAGPFGMMLFQPLVYGFILLIPLSIGVAILRSGPPHLPYSLELFSAEWPTPDGIGNERTG